MLENYSVLMSVYVKEKSDYLREAMQSIYNQTFPTDDFVLICDGTLTKELDLVIEEMESLFGDILKVYRLEKNSGLGNALNFGLDKCKNELIARMDSDDISFPDRVERELQLFYSEPDLSIVSGIINEFYNDPGILTGKRKVPEFQNEIVEFSKHRNPFNHPCVVFKKSHVKTVGGYSEEFPLFEDYYLWVRLLKNGYKGRNIQQPILSMRVPPELYLRRGGMKYAKNLLKFNRWMKKIGWIGNKEYISGALPHAFICILPNSFRKLIYKLIRTK